MSKLVRVLFATALLAVALGSSNALAACISGGQVSNFADCIATDKGAGDCLLAWSVDNDGAGNPPLDDGVPTGKVVCADGDPCDGDGHVNGRCTFHVGACVNAGGSCSALSLTTFDLGKPSQKDIDKKSAKEPYFVYNRRALVTAVDAILGGSEACTDPNLEIVVPLKSKGGTCSGAIDKKCASDQDCDLDEGYCVFAYSKNKATIKAEVSDAGGDGDGDSLKFTCLPAAPASPGQCTEVFQVTNSSDLIGGPLAQGRVNDWMLRNNDIRVLVRDVGRQFSFMRTFGGTILDADLTRANPADDRDSFMGMQPMVHIAATQNTQNISVLNDGTDCTPGILSTSGPDDLFDVLSPDVAIFAAGNTLSVPPDAIGINLPLNLTTEYRIRPDKPYVEIDTTFENTGGTDLDIYVGDYINGGGQLENFGPGVGFGDPLLRKGGNGTTSPGGAPQGLDFLGFQGAGDADGVAYGLVLPEAPSDATNERGTYYTGAFTQSGVSAWVHNSDLVTVLNSSPINKPTPPFAVPAGGTNTIRRWFVVGKTINDVTKAREELFGYKIGVVQGVVTSNGAPVKDAHIVALRNDIPGNRCGGSPLPCRNVFSATTTDEFGFYRMWLPNGDYDVQVRGPGIPYEASAATPTPHPLSAKGGKTIALNLDLPTTGGLHVVIKDQNGDPIAGKVSIVGFEAAPDPLNIDSIAGFIDAIGRRFGYETQDKGEFTPGIVKAIFADQTGDTGTVPLEPGSYHVVVSHGAEYDVYDQAITITAGATTTINPATIHQVVDTTGFVAIDTHVHMLESPDSEVTDVNRIVSEMAEGVDFFTPTDHDHVHDLTGTIAAMGVTGLIATAPSEEITTFNFGHFNVWPLTVNGSSITGGALDWGRAPSSPGLGFVGDTNYDLSPTELFGSFNPATHVIQINHFNSGTLGHFNSLGIDAQAIPPISSNRVYRCTGGDRTGLPCQALLCLGGTNDGNTCSTNADCPGGDKCNTPPVGRGCPGGSCVDQPDNLGSFIRQDPAISNLYGDNYTTLEIWIEQSRSQTNLALHDNLADWAGLLNQGDFKSGTADSDTHVRTNVPAGGPRTYVASATDDPGSIDPAALAQAVIDGRAIGSGGLFMRVELEGDGGATASAALGDPRTVPATLGSGNVNIHVEAPPWAQFDRIEIYANSNPSCKSEFTFMGILNPSKCDVTPLVTLNKGTNFTVNTVTGVSGSGQRLVADVSQPLTITADTWVIAVARGTDGVSKPLFPVNPTDLPARQCLGGPKELETCTNNAQCTFLGTCANMTLAQLTDSGVSPPWNLSENGQLAMAFSNPLFFDRQNDGFCNGGTACP